MRRMQGFLEQDMLILKLGYEEVIDTFSITAL